MSVKQSVEYYVCCDMEMCTDEAQGEASLDAHRANGWFITDNEQFVICPKCMSRQKVNVHDVIERDAIFEELVNWVNAFDTTGADITPVQALAIANFVIETFRKERK